MKTFLAHKAVALLAASLGFALPLRAELPVYEVAKTKTPIDVDGKLDDPAWEKAAAMGKFTLTADGKDAPVETEAKIVYDDKFLYFAFRCQDDNIAAKLKERDAGLWEEEVVEVFLQADPGARSYIELEVNPLGTLLDIFLLDTRKAIPHRSWNSAKIKWAVDVDGSVNGKAGDKGWTCEIALPMEDVVSAPHLPPRAGDMWRLNIYRIEKLPVPAFIAWSPTGANDFHIPGKFGKIVFTNTQVP